MKRTRETYPKITARRALELLLRAEYELGQLDQVAGKTGARVLRDVRDALKSHVLAAMKGRRR
jgi:hypothetical protein